MKYFVTSDIHSYFDRFKKALDESGFDKNNPEHCLIICGDLFDRGSKPMALIKFLRGIERKVIIRGNHEDLLEELCQRQFPYSYDKHNGTFGTVWTLGWSAHGDEFWECCERTWNIVKDIVNSSVDYFETKNYIFVHSWIPLIRTSKENWAFNDDWRNASKDAWYEARWGNPYELADMGLKPDKTVVFGHWHTSWPRAYFEGKEEFGSNADFSPYYGKGYIGLDACTANSGKVNVIIIEDNPID